MGIDSRFSLLPQGVPDMAPPPPPSLSSLLEADSKPELAGKSALNPTALKVVFRPYWEVNTSPITDKQKVGVLNIKAKDVNFLMSHDEESGWNCTWFEPGPNGKRIPHRYSQDMGAPPAFAAPYIQKAFEAMEYLQKEHPEIKTIVNMDGLAKLQDLSTLAGAVVEVSGNDKKLTASSQAKEDKEYEKEVREGQSGHRAQAAPMTPPVKPQMSFHGGPSGAAPQPV